MRVIVGCEFSQIVTMAFRKKGHEAFSCDLLPTDGEHPEWHYQEDIFEVLRRESFDLGIFHPPCTHLAVSGAAWFAQKRKDGRQQAGIDFFMAMINAPIPKIAVENPICIMSTIYRKPDQIIQPYMFGQEFSKPTCLWLKGLPKLISTNIVGKGEFMTCKNGHRGAKWNWGLSPGPERAKIRSRTFQGIANAMAEQWG